MLTIANDNINTAQSTAGMMLAQDVLELVKTKGTDPLASYYGLVFALTSMHNIICRYSKGDAEEIDKQMHNLIDAVLRLQRASQSG